MGLMINDVDLKTTYKFVTTDVNGRGAPPVERSTLEDLSFDGAIELGTKLAKRDISITGYVYGTSPSDARTNKDNLISFISQGYTDELKITFPDTNRSIYAKLAGTPIVWQAQGPTLNAVAYSVTMNFVALDPYFYGTDISPMLGTGMVKLSTEAPLYLVDPRRSLYKREPKMKVYPVTVVNLLGKYGDFETGSDGWADGWSKHFSEMQGELATDKVVTGSKSQHMWESTTRSLIILGPSGIFKVGNTHFISFWGYYSTGINNIVVVYSYSPWRETPAAGDRIANRWNKYYTGITASYTGRIGIVFNRQTNDIQIDAWVDGCMVIDLTAMGTLPPPLKEYFNNVPSTWADLATSSDIEAIDGKKQSGNAWLNDLLPYVNGVGTLGYAWGV